jgi:hypothetical protein
VGVRQGPHLCCTQALYCHGIYWNRRFIARSMKTPTLQRKTSCLACSNSQTRRKTVEPVAVIEAYNNSTTNDNIDGQENTWLDYENQHHKGGKDCLVGHKIHKTHLDCLILEMSASLLVLY